MSFTNPTTVKANPYALIPADNFVAPKLASGQYFGVEPIASLAFGIVANTDLSYIVDMKSVQQLNAVKALLIDARYLNVDILVQVDDSIGIPFYVRANTMRQFNIPAISTKRIKISAVPLQTDSYGQFNNVFGNCVIYAFNYTVAETIVKRRKNRFMAAMVVNFATGQHGIASLSVSLPTTQNNCVYLRKIVACGGDNTTSAPYDFAVETNVLNPYTQSAFATATMLDSSVQLTGAGVVRGGVTTLAKNGTLLDRQIGAVGVPYRLKFAGQGLRLPGPQAGASIIGSVVVYNNLVSQAISVTFYWDELNDNTVSQ